MAAKGNFSLLFEDKQNNVNLNGKYNNFTLNKDHQISLNAFSGRSKSVITERKKVLDYDVSNISQTKNKFHSWKKSTLSPYNVTNSSGKEDRLKKEKVLNASTLSLCIEGYENSSEAYLCDVTKEDLKKNDLLKKGFYAKQIDFDSTLTIQNVFEFSRQEENGGGGTPEVAQFRASQKLLNPNPQIANNLYESLPAGKNAQPPPPPPATPAPAPLPLARSPAPGNQPQAANQNIPSPKNNNNNRKVGGNRRGGANRGRGGGGNGQQQQQKQKNVKQQPQKRPSIPAAGVQQLDGGNGKIEDEMKSGQQQLPPPNQQQQQQSSVQQKSDVSLNFAGVDKEYQEQQTQDPAYDLANDMEYNDIYAIRLARERRQRKKREKYACLVIIIMVCMGTLLTLTSGILIAVDLS